MELFYLKMGTSEPIRTIALNYSKVSYYTQCKGLWIKTARLHATREDCLKAEIEKLEKKIAEAQKAILRHENKIAELKQVLKSPVTKPTVYLQPR